MNNNKYMGMWFMISGYIWQKLLPNGLYDEARGSRKIATLVDVRPPAIIFTVGMIPDLRRRVLSRIQIRYSMVDIFSNVS